MSQKAAALHPARAARTNQKRFAWILAGIAILLLVAFFGVGAVAANQLTVPRRIPPPQALRPEAYNLSYEDINLPARQDATGIAAWYIPSDEDKRVIILVHGRDDSRTHGFADLFVSFANNLHKAGFSVMMIDLRGHGESDDSRYTFGIKERLDVLGAVDWLEGRGYQPGKIGVLGYSLGAASVIGAASEEQDIGAIWIDSAYAEFRSILERNWKMESGLPQAFLYSTELMSRLMYGYDIADSRPIDEIGKIAPRPIFMAHCKNDNMIPISHMDQLLSVAQNTREWVIQNCDENSVGKDLVPDKYNNHAIGYPVQPEVYGQKVIDFFNETLK